MNQEPKSIDEIIALVRTADPVSDPRTDAVDTEAELRILLANLPAASPARRRGRRRRAIRVGAVALGATAATAVIINVIGTGGSHGNGGFVSQARAAEIVQQVKEKLTSYAPGQVIETLTRTHETGPGVSLWSTDNTWQSTTPPYNERQQFAGGGRPSYETTVTAQGIPQTYDTATNTIYEPEAKLDYDLKPAPRAGTETLTVPRAEVLVPGVVLPAHERGTVELTVTDRLAQELRDGRAEVAYTENIVRNQQGIIGIHPAAFADTNTAPSTFQRWAERLQSRGTRVKLDGRDAIEIVSPTQGTFWFSAKSLLPIRSVWRLPVDTNGSSDKGYDVYTTDYRAYRVLTGASAQQSLSIQAAHPSATVVTDPLKYRLKSGDLG